MPPSAFSFRVSSRRDKHGNASHTTSASTASALGSSSSFFSCFSAAGAGAASTALSMSAKILAANSAGWSMLNPEVRSAVSKSNAAVAEAPASPAACLAFKSRITGEVGLISMVFFPFMYSDARESPMACAFMMRSMLADQPNLEVTKTQGVSVRRLDTVTFSTLPKSSPCIQSVKDLYSSSISLVFAASASSSSPRSRSSLEMSTRVFSLYCARLVIATSSMGSMRNSTSKPFLVSCSRNGEFSAASRVSAAT
mmetsp:Transcript_8979/g.37722  ORF Transcript_8979/g.37722 Transcript_8979/m.37722 type:complete len:254 (+) Transcript_8979:397-1158(+)